MSTLSHEGVGKCGISRAAGQKRADSERFTRCRDAKRLSGSFPEEPMKITCVEKWRVVVPCREGLLERSGRWYDPGLSAFDRIPKWIIRIHTDTGICGIGESSRGESSLSIDAGTQALLGKDPRTFALSALPLPPEASYGTFEMALADLLGHTWSVPVYQLLGGARQKQVLIDFWASRVDPEKTAAQARSGALIGFHGIKIKAALANPRARRLPPVFAAERAAVSASGDRGVSPAGSASPGDHSSWAAIAEDDPIEERVAAIAAACGPHFTITVDPNCRFYEPAAALKLARRLERYNVLVLEDPFPWRDRLEDYRAFRQASPLPVAIHTSSPAAVLNAIRLQAVDYVNLNGSMFDFVHMAWMVEQAGLRCWHGSGVDLGIRDASYLHACLATTSCTLPSDLVGNYLREDDLLVRPIDITEGYAAAPTEPGLGVELDEEALKRYRVPN